MVQDSVILEDIPLAMLEPEARASLGEWWTLGPWSAFSV